VAVEYVLAALPPQPAASSSHDDWVSAVCCCQTRGRSPLGATTAPCGESLRLWCGGSVRP